MRSQEEETARLVRPFSGKCSSGGQPASTHLRDSCSPAPGRSLLRRLLSLALLHSPFPTASQPPSSLTLKFLLLPSYSWSTPSVMSTAAKGVGWLRRGVVDLLSVGTAEHKRAHVASPKDSCHLAAKNCGHHRSPLTFPCRSS